MQSPTSQLCTINQPRSAASERSQAVQQCGPHMAAYHEQRLFSDVLCKYCQCIDRRFAGDRRGRDIPHKTEWHHDLWLVRAIKLKIQHRRLCSHVVYVPLGRSGYQLVPISAWGCPTPQETSGRSPYKHASSMRQCTEMLDPPPGTRLRWRSRMGILPACRRRMTLLQGWQLLLQLPLQVRGSWPYFQGKPEA